MANDHRSHVLVLPEDDANRQIANGFVLGLESSFSRKIRIPPEAGGWLKVLNRFQSDHVGAIEQFPNRYMVLMIDFDGDAERLETAKSRIPEHLIDRFFILGVLSEPEALRSSGLGTYETIGRKIELDCREGTDRSWSHPLLENNKLEMLRLSICVHQIPYGDNLKP